ncbi:hypothetical protein BESB_038240 [Besnoitia besnoiti]|uniref:PH domain-containing protein n=1 Tax=Besnoitia besnoiti TaxID=94643 RepID=A0A2A9MMM5_BESBE|nr:hypothetical protein BESB_038240 [Besnoitia besnoiti]PFH37366.1 hypothetical protein BESB_038240 [Besnoitia besnoiti]
MKHLRLPFCVGAAVLATAGIWGKSQAAGGKDLPPGITQRLATEARNDWADGVMKLSFKQEETDDIASKQAMRICGEGHRGLLAMIVDSTDSDARILTAGQLTNQQLLIYSGNVIEAEYNLKDIVVPVETVNDKCFAIRAQKALATLYCARDTRRRDQWLNYIHEAIFCKKTGVKGRLPAEPGKDVEQIAVAVEIVPTEEPSGINLHLVIPQPPHPSISDFPNPLAENDPESPNTFNSEGEPKGAQELVAIHEAMAEQNEVPITDERVPKAGYAAHRMGRE